MKTKIILLGIFVLLGSVLNAQSFNRLLDSVKVNSPQIKALNYYVDAKRVSAKTNIFPANPKLSYGIFPSATTAGDIKNVLSISQEFDFPTKYFQLSKLNKLSVEEAELSLLNESLNIITEFQKLYIKYIYANKDEALLKERISLNKSIKEAFEKKFDLGDATILELQKSKMELTLVQTELTLLKANKQSLIERINYHSGLNLMDIEDLVYPSFDTYELADLIMARSANQPAIALSQNQLDQSEQGIKLAKTDWLPGFEIAYEMEKTANEKYRGVGFGLSIPIWNNLNKVKLAKAENILMNQNFQNELLLVQTETKQLFSEMVALQTGYEELKESLSQFDIDKLLKKSFELGEISVIEFYTELNLYFQINESLLNLEKELRLVQSELYNFNLIK